MNKKKVIIIGGGPAAMMAAYKLADSFKVELYEKEKTIGQKFLVAGKGGFNLTNNLDTTELTKKYTPYKFMDGALSKFDSDSTIDWLQSLGIKTFVGSGGKVLAEKSIRPAEVLKAIKEHLISKGVNIFTQHKFVKFDGSKLIFHHKNIELNIEGDFYIFALGGTSWTKTGSDGKWTSAFEKIGINIIPFEPSNCGINIEWNESIKTNHSGKPIKNAKISSGYLEHNGELTITDYGIEGNAIYPIIPALRDTFISQKEATIQIDFKPNNDFEQLFAKIFNAQSHKDYAKNLNLNRTQISLIKNFTSKEEYQNPELFVQKIKCLTIPVKSLRPIEEAISTVGGIDIEELNDDFSLKKYPNVYTLGEMVDWDAPTGGFLLQGCFSMGYYAAESIIEKVKNQSN